MTDSDHLDYRLRCHTKRTDLPADVVRDIAEAYHQLITLQRRIDDMKEGFEGSCTACEPVAVMNKELREEIELVAQLNERMADILTKTANALHGDAPKNGLHSWHDLPELAEKLNNKENTND